MREYDENIQHYAPVLRRIIILVAVITAVPVVLWTITAFMRTYIAQPTISAPRPLVTATDSAVPASAETAPAASAASAPSAPAVVEARATTTDARSTDVDAKGDRTRDSAATAPGADITSATPAATPAAAAAPSVFPDPTPALTAQLPQAPPAAASDATDDALPPPDPITGRVPLPRHRPNILALADTDVVPLPRARPGTAPEPAASPPADTPQSGYDPGIGHD
jgi:hypothetical protein